MLNNNREILKNQAEFYKKLYFDGDVDINITQQMVMPYINLLCIEREKLSKAYGQYLPTITFEKFMRNP